MASLREVVIKLQPGTRIEQNKFAFPSYSLGLFIVVWNVFQRIKL